MPAAVIGRPRDILAPIAASATANQATTRDRTRNSDTVTSRGLGWARAIGIGGADRTGEGHWPVGAHPGAGCYWNAGGLSPDGLTTQVYTL